MLIETVLLITEAFLMLALKQTSRSALSSPAQRERTLTFQRVVAST